MVTREEIRKSRKSGIAMEMKAMRMIITMIVKILIGAKMNRENAGRGHPEAAMGSEEVGNSSSKETTIRTRRMKIKEEKKEAKETREVAKVEKEEDSEEGQPIRINNVRTSVR